MLLEGPIPPILSNWGDDEPIGWVGALLWLFRELGLQEGSFHSLLRRREMRRSSQTSFFSSLSLHLGRWLAMLDGWLRSIRRQFVEG